MQIINRDDESGHPCRTPRSMLKLFEKEGSVNDYTVNIGIEQFDPLNETFTKIHIF